MLDKKQTVGYWVIRVCSQFLMSPRAPSRSTQVRPPPPSRPCQSPPLATRGLTPASISCMQTSPASSIHARTTIRRSRSHRRRGTSRRPPPPPPDAEWLPEHGGTLRSPYLAVDRRRRPPRPSGASEPRPASFEFKPDGWDLPVSLSAHSRRIVFWKTPSGKIRFLH